MKGTMKVAVMNGIGKMGYTTRPIPTPKEDEVLVKLEYVGICGSDMHYYGEWKTGVRNDGFQYAFVSLGNKLGMAIGTSALAGVLSALSFAPNQVQNGW